MLTPLPHTTTHIINSAYVTELFYDVDHDIALVCLVIQLPHEVDWAHVTSITEDSFLWYS